MDFGIALEVPYLDPPNEEHESTPTHESSWGNPSSVNGSSPGHDGSASSFSADVSSSPSNAHGNDDGYLDLSSFFGAEGAPSAKPQSSTDSNPFTYPVNEVSPISVDIEPVSSPVPHSLSGLSAIPEGYLSPVSVDSVSTTKTVTNGTKRPSSAIENESEAKRQRRLEKNRRTAMQSRQRKKLYVKTLEDKVSHLTALNEALRTRMLELVSENNLFRQSMGLPTVADPSARVASSVGAVRSDPALYPVNASAGSPVTTDPTSLANAPAGAVGSVAPCLAGLDSAASRSQVYEPSTYAAPSSTIPAVTPQPVAHVQPIASPTNSPTPTAPPTISQVSGGNFNLQPLVPLPMTNTARTGYVTMMCFAALCLFVLSPTSLLEGSQTAIPLPATDAPELVLRNAVASYGHVVPAHAPISNSQMRRMLSDYSYYDSEPDIPLPSQDAHPVEFWRREPPQLPPSNRHAEISAWEDGGLDVASKYPVLPPADEENGVVTPGAKFNTTKSIAAASDASSNSASGTPKSFIFCTEAYQILPQPSSVPSTDEDVQVISLIVPTEALTLPEGSPLREMESSELDSDFTPLTEVSCQTLQVGRFDVESLPDPLVRDSIQSPKRPEALQGQA
eukprot:Rmarinus@m.13634